MTRSRIVFAFIVICILSVFVTACGGGGGGGGGSTTYYTVTFVSGTGMTWSQSSASVASGSTASSVPTLQAGYTNLMVNGVAFTSGSTYTTGPVYSNTTVTGSATQETVPGAPTIGTPIAGNAQISVAFTAPASNGGAAITSYTATCTSTTSGSTSGTASGASSPIVVTGLTNGDPYTCTVYATNSAGNSPASSPSTAVTPTLPTPTLTAISFADGCPVKWCIGECGIFPITLTGANFATGQIVSCSPDPDIQSVTLVSSTQLTVYIAMDATHQGSGARSCKVCKSDGTGCSATVQFGLYSLDMCGGGSASGEKFCLNPQETVAGQNLYKGVPQNGYIDKFVAKTGVPDGKIFTGAPSCCLAVDNLTGFLSLDGLIPNDQNGGKVGVPTIVGEYADQPVATAARNGYACELQPTQTNDLSCVSWQGGSSATNTVMHVAVGTNPQSLAIGVIGGKTYVFVLTVGGGTPLLWSVDISDGMTNVLSQSIVGITSGAPGGSAVVAVDSPGRVVVISFGDDLGAIFNESTLASTATITHSGMPAGETPINMIAVGNVAVVGNFDGTFTKVDPSAGAASSISSEQAAFMPVGMIPAVTADGAGVDFYACPNDGVSSCSSFTLP